MNSLTLFLPTKFLQELLSALWHSCKIFLASLVKLFTGLGQRSCDGKAGLLESHKICILATSPPPTTSQTTKESYPGPGPTPLAALLNLLALCKLQRFIQGEKTLGWNHAWRLQAHHALPEWDFNELQQITCTVLTWLPKAAQSKVPSICDEPIFNLSFFFFSSTFFFPFWSFEACWRIGGGGATQQTQKENINISFGILHNISQWQQQVFDRPANFPKTTSCQPGCDSGMSQCCEMGCCQPLPQPKMPSPQGLLVY